MDSYFVDSSFWKALVDKNDDFYDMVWKLKNKINGENLRLITTNYMIDELYTLVRVKCSLEACRELSKMLDLLGDILVIERVRISDEKRAWDWFWKPWKKLSYTDCTSFAVMERLEIKQVLTFDEHFKDAGFEVVG